MLYQSADTIVLTGLTRSQLREWTGRGRRGVLTPDVEPDGPGRHALFSWQTMLALRILLALHRDFAAEVGAWAPAIRLLRSDLERRSFPSLWRKLAFFPNPQGVLLVDSYGIENGGGFIIPLDSHLTLLATKLSLPRPDQLPLFPVVMVSR